MYHGLINHMVISQRITVILFSITYSRFISLIIMVIRTIHLNLMLRLKQTRLIKFTMHELKMKTARH